MNRPEDAERVYLRAIELDPWQKNSYHHLKILRARARKRGPELAGIALDELLKQAEQDPLASTAQMKALTDAKGKLLRKDPDGWLRQQVHAVRKDDKAGNPAGSLARSEELWKTAIASPFSSTSHVTEAALQLAYSLAETGNTNQAIVWYERILDAGTYARGVWPSGSSKQSVEGRLLKLCETTDCKVKAREIKQRIRDRDKARAQPKRACDTKERISDFLLLGAIFLALQSTGICAALVLLLFAYGAVRLKCRGQPSPRRASWPLKQLLKIYAACFLSVNVMADGILILFWDNFGVFDEMSLPIAFGLAVVGSILASVWGWFSFAHLGEVASWSPPVTKRERLRGVLGLLQWAAVVGCVTGHIPAFVIVYVIVS